VALRVIAYSFSVIFSGPWLAHSPVAPNGTAKPDSHTGGTSWGTGEADDDLLPTLLAVCEDFLANASQLVHRELDTYLLTHDVTGGPGWLIDMLALIRLRLQIAAAPDQTPTPDASAVKTRGD
jgi:hypothetical protein